MEDEIVEEKEIKIFKEIVEWCFCIFLAIIIALATRYYIFTSTVVKQSSMYPTLNENQRIALSRINRITKAEYKQGDIVTFEEPSEIKRGTDVDIANKVAIYNYEPQSFSANFSLWIFHPRPTDQKVAHRPSDPNLEEPSNRIEASSR